MFDGSIGTHVDESTTNVTEKVGENRVNHLDSRAVRLEDNVLAFHYLIKVLEWVLQECDVSVYKCNPLTTRKQLENCLLYTSPSPRDATLSRMPSSA